jgi:hypothetical protein
VTYGGDSGNRIFVRYWRCPLIRVSVIRGSTVVTSKYLNPVCCTHTHTHTHIAFVVSNFFALLKERND